nr:MAG TPA: hypothetical protein [Caudoviricetes sp.]
MVLGRLVLSSFKSVYYFHGKVLIKYLSLT